MLDQNAPANIVITQIIDVMLKLGYSEAQISAGLETVIYQRKQYGL